MHLTNLQIVLALFAASNLTMYVLGRRHGRKALRREFLAADTRSAVCDPDGERFCVPCYSGTGPCANRDPARAP